MYYIGTEAVFNGYESRPAFRSEAQYIKMGLNMTGEFARDLIYTMDSKTPFRKFKPISEQDARDGRICIVSGMWYPGRMVVYKGGLPYGFDRVKEQPLALGQFQTIGTPVSTIPTR